MELPFVVATLTRRGLLTPGRPNRVAAQLHAASVGHPVDIEQL
ncbi:hypothetical protein [Verrucosispora sp. TAA-831]